VVGQTYRYIKFGDDPEKVTNEDLVDIVTSVEDDLCVFQSKDEIPVVDVLNLVPANPDERLACAPITRRLLTLATDLGLHQRAAKYGISFNQLLSMVIELDTAGLPKPGTLARKESLQAAATWSLKKDGHEPSCYNAATILYNLLSVRPLGSVRQGRQDVALTINGAPDSAGFNGRKTPDPTQRFPGHHAELQLACTGLRKAMLAAAERAQRRVFGVNFGIHGFVIVVTEAYAEVLQSFAGKDGDMLANYLDLVKTRGHIYTAEALAGFLAEMVVENEDDDQEGIGAERAQRILFGGRADDPVIDPVATAALASAKKKREDAGDEEASSEDEVVHCPRLEHAPFRWVECDLKGDAEIDEAITSWITVALAFYEEAWETME
jgi:hypothetical protein